MRRRVRDTVEWSGGASWERHVEKLPQAQRIGGTPGNRTFRVEALEVANQQHPEVAARCQTWPTDPVGIELGALLLDEGIEARLVENTIQAFIERVARAARQIRTGHPHRPLPPPTAALAHCHEQKCSTSNRPCRSLSATFTIGCQGLPGVRGAAVATSMYLLLAYLKFVLRLGWSLNQMLQVLQLNVFERRPLEDLFKTKSPPDRARPQLAQAWA